MDEAAKSIFLTIGVFISFLLIAGLFIPDDPKCVEYGCDNDAREGSSYCYTHFRTNLRESSGSSKSSTSKTSAGYNSSTSSSSKNYGSSNTSSKKDSYKSYDDGYEDVYENDDYDWDRYYSDDDYADGVDDAMDELDW